MKYTSSPFPTTSVLKLTPAPWSYPLPKRQILDFSKLKGFADDNFNLVEYDRMFFILVENTFGKGEIARNEQFLLFPQYFQKTSTADT